MFDSIDYLIAGIIDLKLNEFASNPHKLAFILQSYCNPIVARVVGENYVADCVKYLTQNRIHVSPTYALDKTKKPVIVVGHSGAEDQQFMGEYGYHKTEEVTPPLVGMTFRPTGQEDSTTLQISVNYDVEAAIKAFKYLGTKNQFFTVKSLIKKESFFLVELDRAMEDGLAFGDWAFYTAERNKSVRVSQSIDNVNVEVTLVTNGDPSMHRLLRTLTRAILKSSRPLLEASGFQVSTISYGTITPLETIDTEFLTSFTLHGKASDAWIDFEYDLPNKLEICLEANSCNPDNETVELGSTILHL